MKAQARMFAQRRPAAPRRVLAHATDAGEFRGHFECRRCGFDLGWLSATDTEVRRGVPCPRCNPPGTPGLPEGVEEV